MTNAALAEQVAALANQVQALTALHTSAAAREVTYSPSAAPVIEALDGSGSRAFPRMAPLAQTEVGKFRKDGAQALRVSRLTSVV